MAPWNRDSLLPVETLLIGGWLALTLLRLAAAEDAFAAAELELAETLLAVFLVFLALRRRARGAGLLLAFVALALALFGALHLAPASVRPRADASALFRAGAILAFAKVLTLFGMFLASYRVPRRNK